MAKTKEKESPSIMRIVITRVMKTNEINCRVNGGKAFPDALVLDTLASVCETIKALPNEAEGAKPSVSQ